MWEFRNLSVRLNSKLSLYYTHPIIVFFCSLFFLYKHISCFHSPRSKETLRVFSDSFCICFLISQRIPVPTLPGSTIAEDDVVRGRCLPRQQQCRPGSNFETESQESVWYCRSKAVCGGDSRSRPIWMEEREDLGDHDSGGVEESDESGTGREERRRRREKWRR